MSTNTLNYSVSPISRKKAERKWLKSSYRVAEGTQLRSAEQAQPFTNFCPWKELVAGSHLRLMAPVQPARQLPLLLRCFGKEQNPMEMKIRKQIHFTYFTCFLSLNDPLLWQLCCLIMETKHRMEKSTWQDIFWVIGEWKFEFYKHI